MVDDASEKALSELERAKNFVVDDLYVAARILNLDLDLAHRNPDLFWKANTKNNSDTFRDEWVLKWLVRKLGNITNQFTGLIHQEAELDRVSGLITNSLTWTLLHYLTISIPQEDVLEILLDRKFLKTFRQCLDVFLRMSSGQAATLDGAGSSKPKWQENNRPAKRRRLSRDTMAGTTTNTVDQYDNLRKILIRNAESLALCVRQDSHSFRKSRRMTDEKWSDSTEEAARLTCNIITLVHTSLCNRPEGSTSRPVLATPACNAVQLWLDLYHNQGGFRADPKGKEASHFFNLICLEPILSVLNTFSLDATTRAAIERQVALMTILPIRADFEHQHAMKWKIQSGTIEWPNIQQVTATVSNDLQPLTNKRFGEGNTSVNLSRKLLEIAARLVPRVDNLRWQREQPWLEALYLGLLIGVCWPDMPKLFKTMEGNLEPEKNINEVLLDRKVSGSPSCASELLEGSGITLSKPTLTYIIISILTWKASHIPVATIASLVSQNSELFVPATENKNSKICLNAVCEYVSNYGKCEKSTYDQLLQQVVIALMQGFAKARKLDLFIGIWQEKLQNSFYARLRGVVDHPSFDSMTVWDDEELFDTFRLLSETQTASSFGKQLLENIVGKVSELGQRTGSTNDIFAQLAIMDEIIAAKAKEYETQADAVQSVENLTLAVSQGLNRSTDYQGHRWRLWHVLHTVLNVFAGKELFENAFDKAKMFLQSVIKTQDLHSIDKNRQRGSSQLMESVQCFTFMLSAVGKHQMSSDNFDVCMEWLSKHLLIVPDDATLIQYGDWDGKLNTLIHISQVVSTSLCQLCLVPELMTRESNPAKILLSQLVRFALHPEGFPTGSYSTPSLLEVIEVLLGTLEDANIDLSEYFLQAILSLPPGTRISSLRSHLPRRSISRRHGEKIVEMILACLRETDIAMDSTRIADLLQVIVILLPVQATFVKNSDLLLQLIDRLNHKMQIQNLEASANISSCVQKIVDLSWSRILNMSDQLQRGESVKRIYDLCKQWMKQSLQIELMSVSDYIILRLARDICCSTSNLPTIITNNKKLKLRTKFEEKIKKLLEMIKPEPLLIVRILPLWILAEDLLAGDETSTAYNLIRDKLGEEEDLSTKKGLSKLILHKLDRAFNPHNTSILTNQSILQYFDYSTEKSLAKLSVNDVQILADRAAMLTDKSFFESYPDVADDAMQSIEAAPISEIRHQLPAAILGAGLIWNFQTDQPMVSTRNLRIFMRIASLEAQSGSTDGPSLVLSLESVLLSLERHPAVLNQHAFDTLLTKLSLMTSSLCKETSNNLAHSCSAADIYDRICHVVMSLLLRYRKRLTGRFHLLLPLLQSLLKGLFYDPRQQTAHNAVQVRQRIEYVKSLPFWLRNTTSPLPVSSVQKLSRILQNLCNPTVSSARSAHRRNPNVSAETLDLNDETKRAKRIAAQHLQYLVMSFCQVSLVGHISPESKDKIMPGLYAVLSAMDMELMRAMNAAMDVNSQAIYKDVYDQWVQFGKWNGA